MHLTLACAADVAEPATTFLRKGKVLQNPRMNRPVAATEDGGKPNTGGRGQTNFSPPPCLQFLLVTAGGVVTQ